MKILALVLLIPSFAWSADVFVALKRGEKAYLKEEKSKLMFKAFDYDFELEKKDCSKKAIEGFKRRFAKRFNRSFHAQGKEGIEVTVGQRKKTILESSEFGKYLNNLSQHMITTRKEADILCKK